MERLNPMNFIGSVYNIVDVEQFRTGMRMVIESMADKGASMFFADNLLTWNKNLSFLRDDFFQDILKSSDSTDAEKGSIWRLYILTYFAEIAGKVEGDFVELGCYTGHTPANIIKKIGFSKLGKKYYLYDLFEWKAGDEHTHLDGHDNDKMYENVKDRFAPYPFVKVIKGSVPESFAQGFPEKIAFAHIDMNHPAPEAGALEKVLPNLSRGGIVIFDDYGWWGYSAQKIALDPIIKSHGLKVLELPTGQALLMKV